MSDGKEMGRLLAEMESAQDHLKTLFRADSKRKEETNKNANDIQLFSQTVEANSKIVTGLAEFMEEFKDGINENISLLREEMRDGMHDLNTKVAVMEVDVKYMKKRGFNWPVVMRGVGDLLKNGKFLAFLTFFFVVVIAVFFPGSAPIIKDLIESAIK